MLQSRLAIVDTETTGSSFTRDRIIEIGIAIVENGKLITTYQTLINPERYLPDFITGITGIRESDLSNAPTFGEIKDEIWDLLKGAIFVAHNARFDKGFLKAEFARFENEFQPKTLCTVRLSRKFFPQYPRHNLDELIQRFHLQCKNRHRALDDALVLVDFLKIVTNTFPKEEIEKNVKQLFGEAAVPPALSLEKIRALPEKPGVYIFYDTYGFPLYVGKSLNIKERVQSHFSASLRESKELKIFQKIDNIESIVTYGELGALLLESSMIKKLQPLYNRRLRKTKRLTMLKKVINKNGFHSLEIGYLETLDSAEIENILGLFKSKKQAEDYIWALAKEYSLCPKLLQLDKSKNECFSYQLKQCKGACINEEKNILYNLRFQQAFEKTRLRSWPYSGTIALEEKNETGDQAEIFFINKWCLIGSGTYSEFGFQMDKSYEEIFDYDQYKILSKHMRKLTKKYSIRQLKDGEFESLKES